MPDREGMICGVERALVEKYLTLIRENYKKADKAAYFLEKREHESNVAGIANVRDALSHLASLLDPAKTPDQRRDQITNAEEHLRRSIIEPYEHALNKRIVRFEERYRDFRSKVLPVARRHPTLNEAPNLEYIESMMKRVNALSCNGRDAKTGNIWDPAFEEGVQSLIEAYETMMDLFQLIEGYVFKYEEIVATQRGFKLGTWGIVVSIIAFVLGVLLTLLLTK